MVFTFWGINDGDSFFIGCLALIFVPTHKHGAIY